MNNIVDIKIKNLIINNQNIGIALIDLFYVKKYGSAEGVQIFFNELKQQCKSEEEFGDLVQQEFENDFKIKTFQPLIEVFSKINNLSSFLNIEKDLKNCFINSKITEQDLLKILELKDLMKQVFEEYFHPEREIQRKLLIAKFADQITFTIKETREELGFNNQRTFKKWLDYFYKDKYNGRRTINILEYIDIWSKFLLGPNEDKIDIKEKSVVYQKRLDERLVFSKNRLKKLTNNNYKLLRIEIDYINKELGLQLPNDVDAYPFSIAEIFKKHIT
ncbi:hypothetical protein [Flavobacterium algicola]|uniref:hypothetical protein n=1 Tax=Flavobacterium algicola TaxID=556529 RepID=UPI001EFD9427|nr:hypothetical protein [Flavobacterium algicola]MCG9792802.1 hypothetical protein [Flavobacterium algicola]